MLNYTDEFSIAVLEELARRGIQFCGITISGFSLAHFMLDWHCEQTFQFIWNHCGTQLDLTHRQFGLSCNDSAPASLADIALDQRNFGLARELIEKGSPVFDIGRLRLSPNELFQAFTVKYLVAQHFDELPQELKSIIMQNLTLILQKRD